MHASVRTANAHEVPVAQCREERAQGRTDRTGVVKDSVSGADSGGSCESIKAEMLWLTLTASSRTGSKNPRKKPGRRQRMKLGLQLGYWGAQPPTNHAELVAAAEEADFDTVFTAEAWGSDAFTPLAWWGRQTVRMRLGTSVVQLSARTPTACAMASLTLDHLSGGRHILGLGYPDRKWSRAGTAALPKPLARTREYVDIVRQVWATSAGNQPGPHYRCR